ncbi:copper homeostasis protein CutC [Novosphingobium profundi]|uniref:copper homeostasis protein CutC n=1 Tax=Novosphingobium profundi TaxID=1774954 RepID=UPI001BDB095E|nr:copper homeostasis protein CutC [Novosphingobium profundi]MBT0667948.1 copper homeostasis protein CutC [Novosphingobium profundi]
MLEVAIEDLRGLLVAREGGAARVELCSALELGGVTPSIGLVGQVVNRGLPVHVLVRSRAGDFVYEGAEVDVMIEDSLAAIAMGVEGLVIGAGDRSGLDCDILRRWVARARQAADARGQNLSLTLHRVFDLLDNPLVGLEDAISLGFDRILTSAGCVAAGDGLARFGDLVGGASGRIALMAGGGLQPEVVAALKAVGIGEFHASCREVSSVPFDPRLRELGFAAGAARCTDLARVRAFVAAAG